MFQPLAQPSPLIALGLQCVSGVVTLFRFIQPPAPGSIIGQIAPLFGTPISLIQTQPTPLGGIPLSSVDGQFATLCGRFLLQGQQTVLDVVLVNPGAPSPTGTPVPFDTRTLLLLLLFLLLSGRGGGLGGILGIPGLGGLGGLAGLTGLQGLTGLAGLPGQTGLDLSGLLQALGAQRQA